jgi:hypothetical protein
MTEQKFTVTLAEDPVTGELVMPLPTELLNQMGWDFGDTLIWNDQEDGTFTLKKKTDGTT